MSIEEHSSGPHSIIREGVDSFVFHVRGVFTKENLEAFAAVERRAWEEDKVDYLYFLVHYAENASLSPGVITTAAAAFRGAPPYSAAIVSTSFLLRTTMDFFARMTRAAQVNNQIRMFTSEGEARQWLDAQREARNRAEPKLR